MAAAAPAGAQAGQKPQFVINLGEGYTDGINALRNFLLRMQNREAYLVIQLSLPSERAGSVLLQLRCSDAYVIGFQGADQWYHFTGEDGGWGADCNVKAAYSRNDIPLTVSLLSLDDLTGLAKFSLKAEGGFKKKHVAMAAAVVGEALRFAPVQEQFARLCGRGFPPVQLALLKETLFNNWATLWKEKDKRVLLPPPKGKGPKKK